MNRRRAARSRAEWLFFRMGYAGGGRAPGRAHGDDLVEQPGGAAGLRGAPDAPGLAPPRQGLLPARSAGGVPPTRTTPVVPYRPTGARRDLDVRRGPSGSVRRAWR